MHLLLSYCQQHMVSSRHFVLLIVAHCKPWYSHLISIPCHIVLSFHDFTQALMLISLPVIIVLIMPVCCYNHAASTGKATPFHDKLTSPALHCTQPCYMQVMLDGQDVRDVPLAWLRRQVGLVSQEPVLFATTIRQNIVFGRPGASQQEVEEAAKAANAHNFITTLPKG